MIRKIVLWVVGLLVVLIAVVLVLDATKPDTFRFERTTSIKASPEKIYPLMSDFRRGMEWSAYEKKDPAMKRTFSGAGSGKGSVYEFEGSKEVGKGRLEIIEATTPSKVVITLDMISPFKGHSIVEYTLEPRGDSTIVTYAMHGRNSFLGRIMCVFIDMDKMVGKDFEAGLANLKAIAERS